MFKKLKALDNFGNNSKLLLALMMLLHFAQNVIAVLKRSEKKLCIDSYSYILCSYLLFLLIAQARGLITNLFQQEDFPVIFSCSVLHGLVHS